MASLEQRQHEKLSISSPLTDSDLFQLQASIPFEGEFDLLAEGLTAFFAQRSGKRYLDICF